MLATGCSAVPVGRVGQGREQRRGLGGLSRTQMSPPGCETQGMWFRQTSGYVSCVNRLTNSSRSKFSSGLAKTRRRMIQRVRRYRSRWACSPASGGSAASCRAASSSCARYGSTFDPFVPQVFGHPPGAGDAVRRRKEHAAGLGRRPLAQAALVGRTVQSEILGIGTRAVDLHFVQVEEDRLRTGQLQPHEAGGELAFRKRHFQRLGPADAAEVFSLVVVARLPALAVVGGEDLQDVGVVQARRVVEPVVDDDAADRRRLAEVDLPPRIRLQARRGRRTCRPSRRRPRRPRRCASLSGSAIDCSQSSSISCRNAPEDTASTRGLEAGGVERTPPRISGRTNKPMAKDQPKHNGCDRWPEETETPILQTTSVDSTHGSSLSADASGTPSDRAEIRCSILVGRIANRSYILKLHRLFLRGR